MKTIIVPVDFSKHSEYALKVAAQIAKRYNAEILVLHMLEMSDVVWSSSEALQQEKTAYFFKLAEQRFTTFLKQPYLDGIKVTSIIKHYKVFSEINTVVETHQADLIVMGSHGVSGLRDYFVGSNTERVVRHAEVPVLVVKQELPDIKFNVVVMACDFLEASIPVYLRTKRIFESLGAKLYLVHVNLPHKRFKSTLEIEQAAVHFLTKADQGIKAMDTTHFIADYTVEKGVLQAATTVGADLIAMPTHGRKGVAHMLEDSIGEAVANHATLPVMTFKM
jgi:nucleotide-binding universal stress UspA family protein